MKMAWRSALLLFGGLGRILWLSSKGARLCATIGAIEGLFLGLLLYVLYGAWGYASIDVTGMALYVFLGAEAFALLGFVIGAITFGLLALMRLTSVRRNTALNLERTSRIAERFSFLCSLCGLVTGYYVPFSPIFRQPTNMSIEGALVGWSVGLSIGALWGGLDCVRHRTHIPPLDALARWTWGDKMEDIL